MNEAQRKSHPIHNSTFLIPNSKEEVLDHASINAQLDARRTH